MKIFLAGTASHRNVVEPKPPRYVLESFYYFRKWQIPLLRQVKDFMLDSGAFTFMGGFTYTKNENKAVQWEEYIERYADFINQNNIQNYFELDIDSVVGYETVLKYRAMLEKKTNKQCIPVWHSTRGVSEFKKSCEEYPYVALGGIVGGEWRTDKEKYIPILINEAHKRGAKVHGLGFTKTSLFSKIKFDSVDSTTWTIGGRMGNMCFFNGTGMRQYYPSLHGKKPINMDALMKHNYEEWLKFQKWADKNL